MSDPLSAVPGRSTVRVRYPEIDRMGVAWHGHYLAWFEIGRTELMRELGCPYGELEQERGILFPVIEAHVRYLASARYDELLSVETHVESVGGARVRFCYRLRRTSESGELARGFTEHAAVDRTGRPLRMPPDLRRRLESCIESE